MDQVTHPDIARAERIAHVMDRAVRLPGTGIRLGLDSILGLVPGVGDTLTLAPSLFILAVAHRHGVPKHRIAAMAGNLGIDWLIGLVPLLGDIFDIGWKANSRNARILREHSKLAAASEVMQSHEKGRAQRDAA